MFYNKQRILLLLLILMFVFSLFTIFISSETILSVSAKSAALYVPETDTFLYRKNENDRLPMASTTKIMTALIALERLREDEVITATKDTVGVEGSSIYLEEGEQMRAIDLVYSMMLQSANDAALTLACYISEDMESFSALMNEKAKNLGLEDTNFENPHGLDAKNHYTSAHDLALITAEALKHETFRKITSTYKKEVASNLKSRLLVNHNKMLKSYDGCIGVKTGYTKKSGRSLVSAAERDGLTLISVTIDAPSDWSDHTKMLDYGYSLIENRALAYKEDYMYTIPVIDGEKEFVTAGIVNDIYKVVNKNSVIETEVKLTRYLVSPIFKGDILGEIIFTENGEIIDRCDIIAKETVQKRKKHKFFEDIFNFLKH